MNILKKVQDIMEIRDKIEKGNRLDELDWIFENGNFLPSETMEVASLLLENVLKEEDDTLQESMINALWSLTASQSVGDSMDWDALATRLPSFSRQTDALVNAIEILGFSRNQKFLPVLKMYLDDPAPTIQLAALDAIVGIKVAHNMLDDEKLKNAAQIRKKN